MPLVTNDEPALPIGWSIPPIRLPHASWPTDLATCFRIGLVVTEETRSGRVLPAPQLLDWLAAESLNLPARNSLVDEGFIRMLVTSMPFAARAPSGMGLQKDVGSTLLWRFPPRRVEAEVIRDVILASGKLNLKWAEGAIAFQR